MIPSVNDNLPGRPAERRNEIVDYIHGMILSGKIKPGERLPVRRKLQEKFNSSMSTVQQAVDRLVSEGFVESRGVGGTFISSNPPHLNQYAVIVPTKNIDSSTSLFWRTLADSFTEYGSRMDLSFKYCCWPTEQASTPENRALARNVSRRSIAGLVFITPPLSYENEKLELLNSGTVPRVVILPREGLGKFKAAAVVLDDLSFIRKALDYFIGNGRRKVAVIVNIRRESWWTDFNGAVKEKKIETRPYWNICVSNEARDSVRNLANLLMQLPREKRPDALLIADDNLAKAAFAGLRDSGSDAVKNLRIISHSNFPFSVHTQLPVKFLGYDSAQVVAALMKALERQRKGENPLEVYENVNAVFDDERTV
ncbi:MAG: GntR family transcriptional regulator [Victivallales bacterium]|jgi:DNA-binding LacI/PurR family transcriptional regulator